MHGQSQVKSEIPMLLTFLGYQSMYKGNSWVDPCREQGLACLDFKNFAKTIGLKFEPS